LIVAEISKRAYDQRLAPRDRYNLERLEKEFTNFAGVRDPQARYDPPTFYLPDKPLLLVADIDLVGSIQKAPFGEQTEAYLQSNPELQIHFGERVTYDLRYRLILGPEHGDRERSHKPSRREKSFKGLTSLYERSYVIAGWEKYHFYLGREYLNWGPSDWNNLLVPGEAYSVDQIGGRVKLSFLRFSFFNGLLSVDSERRFAAHRLELDFKKFVIGLNESVIYSGRGLDPVYFLPFSIFYANQFNERNNDDNILWSIDGKWNALRGLTVYGSFLIDDAQFERDGENPDKFAFDIGGRYAMSAPFGMTVSGRYRRVDIYTYTHKETASVYVSGEGIIDEGDVMLGGAPGPDMDQWRLSLAVYPRANIIVRGVALGEGRGEGNDLRPYQPGDPTDPPFPSGVVQRTRAYGLGARWEFDRNMWIDGRWAYTDVHNIGNVSGADDDSHSFRLEVRFEFL